MSVHEDFAAVGATAWAILPSRLPEIRAILAMRARGVNFSKAEIEARLGRDRIGETAQAGNGMVAIIRIHGIVTQRLNLLDAIFGPGSASTEQIGAQLRLAVSDPSVRSILLEIDSPGGTVNGVQELAAEIMNARSHKVIVAQVNSLAASAAYWLASSASEVVVTPSGEVGSIGVYMMHQDFSAAAEMEGIKVSFVKADDSPYKVEGNQFEPLGSEAEAYLRSQANSFMRDFVGAVAKGRGVSAAKVKADFGKGRTMRAKEAVAAGMADRVASMPETVRRLVATATSSSSRQAFRRGSVSAEGPFLDPLDNLRLRRLQYYQRTSGG